jgi:cell division protease FtsH
LKKSRGIGGYLALLGTLLVIAVLLNGGLNQTVSRRIEYPQLLQMIEEGKVARVAIRNNSLVGLTKNTQVPSLAFPESDYDFETTIGSDFWDTVRVMKAK